MNYESKNREASAGRHTHTLPERATKSRRRNKRCCLLSKARVDNVMRRRLKCDAWGEPAGDFYFLHSFVFILHWIWSWWAQHRATLNGRAFSISCVMTWWHSLTPSRQESHCELSTEICSTIHSTGIHSSSLSENAGGRGRTKRNLFNRYCSTFLFHQWHYFVFRRTKKEKIIAFRFLHLMGRWCIPAYGTLVFFGPTARL